MKKSMSFEEAMERLEEIARQLQEENLSLDESMNLYGEAVKLVKLCGTKLDAAKKKIESQAGGNTHGEAGTAV